MYSVLPFREHGRTGTLIYKKKADITKGSNLPVDRNLPFQLVKGNYNESNDKIIDEENAKNMFML